MLNREPPADFVAKLRAEFPDFQELRFNVTLGRWEFVFLSVVGRPVSQFFGWDRNPVTGEPLQADPATGLLPFRDLDAVAQAEILKSCRDTYLAKDAAVQTWADKAKDARRHNVELRRKKARQRGEDFAYMIQQVDLRRPWVKYHQRSTQKQYFHASAPKPGPIADFRSTSGKIEVVSR